MKLFPLLLFLLLFAPTSALTRRALIIGLGEQQDTEWGTIHGDKDVPVVMEMLRDAGYTDLSTLQNKQATKEEIVKQFKALAQRCRQGDDVYIHFSGHGQQMTDTSGDEKSNGEADALDEAWIPYDAYYAPCPQDRGEKHLCDDELFGLLTGIRQKIGPGGHILVVADACHSGSTTRGSDSFIRGTKDVFNSPSPNQIPAAKAEISWTLLSACHSNETNQEKKKPTPMGSLTYALTELAKTKQAWSNDDALIAIQKMIRKSVIFPQSPSLEGKNDEIISMIRKQ